MINVMILITALVWVWILLKIESYACLCFFFFCGSRALFTGSTNMDFSKFFFKIGSYGTIHTFKNYFATVFSIFSNKQYPNQPIDEFDKAIYDEYDENKLLFLDNL